MPKKRKGKPTLDADKPAAAVTLPELPDEIWRGILYDVGRHSVPCASAVRLVDKWHAKVLQRTQIWTAYDELMTRRAKQRADANGMDDVTPMDRETRKRRKWVRHAEDRGDLMMHKVYIRQCQLDPLMSIQTLRDGLQAAREVCAEFGGSVVPR